MKQRHKPYNRVSTLMPERFTPALLVEFFPQSRTNAFFEALYGDAADGAYDIELALDDTLTLTDTESELRFFFLLHQRPNCCLACNLTTGLPHVFERHPIIGLKDLCVQLATHIQWPLDTVWWRIGETESISESLHRIPLTLLKT